MQLVMDKFGRFVLPKSIRDFLGLAPGDLVAVEQRAQEIVLRPVHEAGLVHEKDGMLVFSGRATGDLRSAVTEHRRSRIQQTSFEKRST